MVDVSEKPDSVRSAIAEGRILMAPQTLRLALSGDAKKGDVLGTARIAGIMAAKKTAELIPLCHPLAPSKVTVRRSIRMMRCRDSSSLRKPVSLVKPVSRWRRSTAVFVACLTI